MGNLDRTIELTRLIQSRMSECEKMKHTAQAENRHLNEEERKRFGEFMNDVTVYTEELEL